MSGCFSNSPIVYTQNCMYMIGSKVVRNPLPFVFLQVGYLPMATCRLPLMTRSMASFPIDGVMKLPNMKATEIRAVALPCLGGIVGSGRVVPFTTLDLYTLTYTLHTAAAVADCFRTAPSRLPSVVLYCVC